MKISVSLGKVIFGSVIILHVVFDKKEKKILERFIQCQAKCLCKCLCDDSDVLQAMGVI